MTPLPKNTEITPEEWAAFEERKQRTFQESYPIPTTNEELARAYLSVADVGGGMWSMRAHKAIGYHIAGAGVDIVDMYKKEGSLASLKVRGIGQGSKILLEGILNEGVDAVKGRLRAEQDAKLERDAKLSSAYVPCGAPFTRVPGASLMIGEYTLRWRNT